MSYMLCICNVTDVYVYGIGICYMYIICAYVMLERNYKTKGRREPTSDVRSDVTGKRIRVIVRVAPPILNLVSRFMVESMSNNQESS